MRPLDYLKRLLHRRFVGLRLDSSPPTKLKASQVKAADVLFCFGGKAHVPWQIISYGSSGPYVHVAICIKTNCVSEATTEGVCQSSLDDLINRYQHVAVTRCRGIKGIPMLSRKVTNYCRSHIQNSTKYDYIGAALSPLYEMVELSFSRAFLRLPNFRWPTSKNRTFCSQFVLQAFVEGGYFPSNYHALGARSPTALAEDNCFELVGYLTRHKNLQSLLSKDIFWTGGG